jgi:hypothetical protein
MPKRFFDDLATKAIEFNLGFVSKIFINATDKSNQGIEDNSSQIIELKPLKSTLPTIQRKIQARPLFRGISDSITRGDLVLFTLISKKFYYIGPLNTFNQPNYSPSNFYSKNLENRNSRLSSNIGEDGYGSQYPKKRVVKLSKPRYRIDLLTNDEYPTSNHSDLLFEGRHGNGIRIGSRSKFPILNISNNNVYTQESLSAGSLISLISKGSLEEHFGQQNSDFKLSIDIPTEKVNLFSLNKGNNSTENVFNYSYGSVEDGDITNDQIIITSDKITFDARSSNGDFTVSSNRNINFGAKQNFTLNNQGQSVINSGNIYLGEKARDKKEPMVLGDELRALLLKFAEILQDSRALVQGVPIPLYNKESGTPMFNRIQALITELTPQPDGERPNSDTGVYKESITKFLSKKHFIETNTDRSNNNEG